MDIARNSNDIVARHLAGAVPHEVLEVIGIRNAYVTRVLAADLLQGGKIFADSRPVPETPGALYLPLSSAPHILLVGWHPSVCRGSTVS
ncbi:MAG: hypothetical protein IMX06_08160 [Kyrpidia tusciae]|nr:hypothetical protein [Kyrpidia tusciae]MBE3552816.1 hypothetical protein [Kyrpidia tusciae]